MPSIDAIALGADRMRSRGRDAAGAWGGTRSGPTSSTTTPIRSFRFGNADPIHGKDAVRSLNPPVRDSWAAMFPAPRQRWVDDLALSGAELASIRAPVLLVHGRDDRVVSWRPSSGQLIDLLPDSRLHVMSNCGHWTMIEKTADFLAVVQTFLAPAGLS